MNTRTKEYLARKKAFEALPKQPTLKNLLKTSFYATRNLFVKKDILKTYGELKQPATRTTEAPGQAD